MYRCSRYRTWTLEGPLNRFHCTVHVLGLGSMVVCAAWVPGGCSVWVSMAVRAAWVLGGCSVWVSCGIYYYNNYSGSTYCKLLYTVCNAGEGVLLA